MVVGKIQFLFMKGHNSSLLPTDHAQLLAVWDLPSSRQAGRESSKKAEVTVLCILLSQGSDIPSTFHNLLVTSKSQALPIHKGSGFQKGINTKK